VPLIRQADKAERPDAASEGRGYAEFPKTLYHGGTPTWVAAAGLAGLAGEVVCTNGVTVFNAEQQAVFTARGYAALPGNPRVYDPLP